MHIEPTTIASATFFFSTISSHRLYGVSLSMITKQSQRTTHADQRVEDRAEDDRGLEPIESAMRLLLCKNDP